VKDLLLKQQVGEKRGQVLERAVFSH